MLITKSLLTRGASYKRPRTRGGAICREGSMADIASVASRAALALWIRPVTLAFGDSAKLADELLELVVKGIKTATCSTEDEPNTSTPGERWVVLDGRGEPRCVIESTEVEYRRFDEIDAAFAYDEGEGDRSLAYWRSAHRAYFGRLGRFS